MSQKDPRLEKLPPPKKKVETIAILKQLVASTAALAELKGFAKTMPNQAILINAIVIQEAKGSSEIENIISSQDELYTALTVQKSIASPQTKEVINYRKAIFKGFEFLKKQGFIRVNDVIEIQRILINNDAGIRSTPGTVLKNDKTGEVVYTPPQDKSEIIELLDNFIIHFNQRESDTSPLIQLAILHFQFESIHPFYDGNGRTGRILNILYLILNELLDIPILYLSSYIIQNKNEYYQLLNKTNRTGEWEDWILYMLRAIEITAKSTIQKIEKIRLLLDDTIEIVKLQAASIYRKELVELLFEHPYCKIEYIKNSLKIGRKAASKYLNQLEEIGILSSHQVGKEKVFINNSLVDLLKS